MTPAEPNTIPAPDGRQARFHVVGTAAGESFIGALPSSAAATLALVQARCPGLAHLDPSHLTLSHVAPDEALPPIPPASPSEGGPEPLAVLRVEPGPTSLAAQQAAVDSALAGQASGTGMGSWSNLPLGAVLGVRGMSGAEEAVAAADTLSAPREAPKARALRRDEAPSRQRTVGSWSELALLAPASFGA
ncbi:hypothetical protein Q5752_002087 [Cryptotrichosporon argae]